MRGSVDAGRTRTDDLLGVCPRTRYHLRYRSTPLYAYAIVGVRHFVD